MTNSTSDRNLVAALAYLLGFVTGIVIFLVEERDKFVRFHALQSILALGGLFVVSIIIGTFFRILGVERVIPTIANALIWIVIAYVWIISMIRAYQGKIFKWPIVGDIAEKKVM